ncbi:class I SAM-dependent methyltransferase [Streptomyces sp. NPDC049881]|uniref:class I SAM-dependent methyltransferase n=1 Tax=Streptomyces sp. NPDC049881 TaxID=3155778 RepID=UPI0034410BA3
MRRAERDVELDRLVRAAKESGARAIEDADLRGVSGLADELDAVALLAMAHTLRRSGLFASDDRPHTLGEVYAASGVAPRHRRIVRRWLWALEREGMLTRETGGWRSLRPVSAAEVERAARTLEDAAAGLRYGPELSRFLLSSVAYLPELLRDEISLQALLFSEGDVTAAEDVYRHNLGSRYINRATATLVRGLARARGGARPLRVLEVGAGVGGTTEDVLAALGGTPVDYHFTDVTRFFLTDAGKRFHARSDIRYGLFDINRDPAGQGYGPGTADVVLAANVLHNARDARRVLARLRALVEPDGWLVFIETSRDHYQLLTSMEFLMSPGADEPDAGFEDFRRGTDQMFPSRTQWIDTLGAAGFRQIACLPGPEDPVARFGQFAYAATAGPPASVDNEIH